MPSAGTISCAPGPRRGSDVRWTMTSSSTIHPYLAITPASRLSTELSNSEIWAVKTGPSSAIGEERQPALPMATQSAWARRRSSSVPEFDYERARYCSRCGQPIVVADAQFCKECGAPLAGTRIFVANPGFNPIVAAVLSFIPGLGHLYKG